jgi:hypothetical protein
VTNAPPDRNAFVTVIFWGLAGFCYNTQHGPAPVCEVGFHPGNGHHSLAVRIYQVNAAGCSVESSPTTRIETMSLKIIGASGRPPEFYQTTDNPFDRYKIGGNNNYDFRWLPDLDGADFYPENYAKHNPYRPRLFISNGTFYTRVISGSKFKLVDGDTDRDIRPFGHVARFMAAGMNPLGTDIVRFEVNGRTFRDFSQTGAKYQIVFQNECRGCAFNPQDPSNETRRNDFHFNRKVVKVPRGRTKYSLKIDGVGSSVPDWCETTAALTDEAPCMGAGYGQTNGF